MSLIPLAALVCDKCRACASSGFTPAFFSPDEIGQQAVDRYLANSSWTRVDSKDLCPECSKPRLAAVLAEHSWWFSWWPWAR